MSQMFKPGDLVVCVDDTETLGKLEHGKTYKVIKSDSYFTFLEGLRDSNKGFYSGRFELVEEIPKTQLFKVGDIVSAFGCEGIVKQIATLSIYPVQVVLNGEHYHWFTLDGKLSDWHKIPSLVLVSRPKKMVTKTVEKWINVYPSHNNWTYNSEAEANSSAGINRIACVKLTGEYEVGVDDEQFSR